MRRLIPFLSSLLLLLGCGGGEVGEDARYLGDVEFRRARMVASLVAPDNGYSRLRLLRYASSDDNDWDRLPVWNPPVALAAADGTPVGEDAPLDLGHVSDEAGLRRLGEAAFLRYPTQMAPAGVLDPARAAEHLVSVRLTDGTRALALTCASCHARGTTLAVASARIDLGWGPGRIAVVAGEEPIAIPDLRPVAWLTHLHRDGTLRNDRVALAIRVETLIITAHDSVVRPPREVALGLAAYLWSLAPPPPDSAPPEIFSRRCAGCHSGAGFAGPPVAIDLVGTDPRVGLSPDRGTGGYRVPSLLGVATRGRLLHDGSVADLDALLDPSRVAAGHRFGLDLASDERAALLTWLRAL